jgi:hypothetical protein
MRYSNYLGVLSCCHAAEGPATLSRYTLLDYGVGNEAEAAEVECFCDFEPRDPRALGRFRAPARSRSAQRRCR